MDLNGARVWVTGASTGIGEALVAPLVARGARVAITARRGDLLAGVAARFAPGAVFAVPADVTDRAAVAAAVLRVESELGGIDFAILNAGGMAGDDTAAFESDPFVRTMILNYFSVVYGIEAVLPGMLERRRGRIAAVASLAGYRALPARAAYGASKAAVIHLLDSLRIQLRSAGIGVTVINPGFVRTPLTARNRFPMPFLMDATRAAERIVDGLEHGRAEIHFPRRLSWTLKLLGMMPRPIYEGVMRVVRGRTQRTQG